MTSAYVSHRWVRRAGLVALAAVVAVIAGVGGCAALPGDDADEGGRRGRRWREPDPYFRQVEPGRGTIFSPLDLPAPSVYRSAAGVPGPEYWQQDVDYVIEATLDADERRIDGHAVITYTNNSPDQLAYLWLHLEQNLFRPDSLGALSVEPGTRFGYRRGTHGGYDIRFVRSGGQDLPLHVYDTLGRVDLPEPLAPHGDTVTFEIGWSFNIPPFGADRMGIEEVEQGVIFQIAQWFPAVAVYDDVHGWNTLPYLGQGEFYTNISSFDVRLTVPRSHIVVATGVLQNPEEVLTAEQQDRLERARHSEETVIVRAPEEVGDPASRSAGEGPLTWHFKAFDCRTFAWASSDAFIWDAAGLDLGVHEVLIQSVYPKEALPLWSQSTEMLRFATESYSERWHPYPYPTATNVNGIVGGMEYPMIIFCRAREDEGSLYGVTSHEIGHNWFPMLVNTDERRHAWMDEGFNTFINYYDWQARHPDEDPVRRRGDARRFVRTARHAEPQPIALPADQVLRHRLGYLEYEKVAVGLVLLREQILGPERFDAAFRRYIREWAFKSPRPADFFRCMEDAAGEGLDWFWRAWFLEHTLLDQAVVGVEVDESRDVIRVTFHNHGDMVMPVVYRVTYEDGQQETRRLPVEAWFTTNRWTTQWPADGRVPVRVEIDPDEVFPDVNRDNNVWSNE